MPKEHNKIATSYTIGLSLSVFIFTCVALTGYMKNMNVFSATTEAYSPVNGTNTNLCDEGYYNDLNDNNACKPLDKPGFGFKIDTFNQAHGSDVYTLATCTELELRGVVDNMPSSGGTINLPTCTMLLTDTIEVPDNTLFQGAGIGDTILQANFSGHVVEVQFGRNVVIRDFTVDSGGNNTKPIIVWYADNVLMERVRSINSSSSGIDFRYSQNVTLRYSTARGAGEYHGVASKDCPNDDPKPDLSFCESEMQSKINDEGTTEPGVLWTQNYAVYSNEFYDNVNGHGINLHAMFGEVAGNFSHHNLHGSKFFDAVNVWIHNNKFSNNSRRGTHINTSVAIASREPNFIIFYENEFVSNGTGGNADYVVRIADPAHNIYLINNTYSSNAKEELRIAADVGVVKICAGSQEESLPVAGNATSYATSWECANPHLISSIDVYLPIVINNSDYFTISLPPE